MDIKPSEPRSSIINRVKNSPNHQTGLAKHLKRTIIIIAAAVVILAGVAIYLLFNSIAPKVAAGTPEQRAAQLVTNGTTSSRTINSSLGFSVTYNTSTFTAEGQTTDASSTDKYVSGNSYSDKELDQRRPYSIVKFKFPANSKIGKLGSSAPELDIITNIRRDYWTNRVNLPQNQNKSKLDILTDATNASEASQQMQPTSTTDLTINGIAYRKIVYSYSSKTFGIDSSIQAIYYLTVQNDRPYFISILPIDTTTTDVVPMFDAVIKSINYGNFDSSQLSFVDGRLVSDYVAKTVLASNTSELPTGTSNVPNKLDDKTIINVVAANQPAVVRIGTAACGDVNLLLPDGSVGLTLKHACAGGVGSGSFVSSDGYIATNGHVTRLTPEDLVSGFINMSSSDNLLSNLHTLYGYLVKIGAATQDDSDSLLAAARTGDQQALSAISALGSLVPAQLIQSGQLDYSYAVQTSNDPIRYTLDSNGFALKTSATVIPAKFVAADVDLSLIANEGGISDSQMSANSTNSDVSILKASGSFPTVQLGSINNLNVGSELTAIGFPAFVDGGLSTTDTKTVPSVTQGTVEYIIPQSNTNNHQLIVTDVPIAPGNSGGPSFDKNGNEVGLNTYATSKCANKACFGDGIVRDIADYRALLASNNITLKTNGQISNDWHQGLKAFIGGDYSLAVKDMQVAKNKYPANYLADGFIDIANTQLQIENAARTRVLLRVVLIATAVVVLIGIVISIVLVRHLLRHRAAPGATPGLTPPTSTPPAATPPTMTPPTVMAPPVA